MCYICVVNANSLKRGRVSANLTQVTAATRLGVSQPYLSQLERGLRQVTPKLARAAAHVYGLPPTALALPAEAPTTLPSRLPHRLAALGYEPYGYLRKGVADNPAVVTLEALSQRDLDARVAEALPWVLRRYPDLSWTWLVDHAKRRNLQNRLGFVVSVARESAQRRGENHAATVLSRVEKELEPSRLVAETTLARESMTPAERMWLRENRSDAARHWNVLSGMTAESLPDAG
jgi:transcriptional regulator with XRE-family HTH domain